MVKISIELTEEDAARFRASTSLLSMRPEVLAAGMVRDQFNAGDAKFTDTRCAHVGELTTCSSAGADEFDELATEIIQKNRALYSRLA